MEAAIASYTGTHRAPAFTDPPDAERLVLTFPDEQGCVDTLHKWPAKFPNAGSAGVYLIFDSNMSLLYVGMTSRDVNRRLGDYFGYIAGRGSGCLVKPNMPPPWKVRPCHVRTVAVSNPDEAPILEAYLIKALKPPENSRRERA